MMVTDVNVKSGSLIPLHFLPLTYIQNTLCKMLDESQARTEIARRNFNNLKYADDTTLKAESEEELKNLT